MAENEMINDNAYALEVQDDASVTEVIEVIEVDGTPTYDIEMDEAFPSMPDDLAYNHALLNNRELNDAHPISAITGLRSELDSIEALQTVYSDKKGYATYYEWADAAYNEYGYFVSLVPGTSTIRLCGGSDIFGVSVGGAAFVGNQNNIKRDNSYGLIVTSGLVDVRCELDVEVGDCVVSNSSGYAAKSKSDFGYRVLAKANKNGVQYAVISLGVQADATNKLGEDIIQIENTLNAHNQNIVSAVNIANQAYNKASEIDASNQIMSDIVTEAAGKVDDMVANVEDLTSQVSSSTLVSAQAKAIAQSAATSAESMRNEAVAKATEALTSTSDLRDELNIKTIEIDAALKNATSELQTTKDSIVSTKNELQGSIDKTVENIEALEDGLKPLTTWPADSENPTGIAGFVARADENSVILGSIVAWKDGTGEDSFAGYIQEVGKGYATTTQFAEIGNVVAGVKTMAETNKGSIEAITGAGGSLAGLQAQVDKNAASISTLASWSEDLNVGGRNLLPNTDFNGEAKRHDITSASSSEGGFTFTPIVQIESGIDYTLSAKIRGSSDIVFYEINEGGNKSHLWIEKDDLDEDEYKLFSIVFRVDEDKTFNQIYICTRWNVSSEGDWFEIAPKSLKLERGNQMTDWELAPEDVITSIAGVTAIAESNKAQLDAVVSYAKDGKTGLAGLAAYVDENSASINTLAEYNNKDSGQSGIAGLMADVNNNTSALSAVAQHSFTDNGTVITGLAGLQAQVNDNTSEVSLVANRVSGKYEVINSWDTNSKKTDTIYYAQDTKLYWYYKNGWNNTSDAYVAGLPASTAGIQVVADDYSSKINSLAAFETTTTTNLARIEQKADANGAYIQSTVSNMDKYSVGPYSQAYGFDLEQAARILEEGMIYVPTSHENLESKTTYHTETYDNDDEAPTSPRTFVPWYLYQWGKIGDHYGWITVDKDNKPISYDETNEENKTNTAGCAVFFASQMIPNVADNPQYGYWYTDGDTSTGSASSYEPYTLYKWDSYKDQSDTTRYHWVAVATLAGNSQNRAISQIRQDAKSIEMSVATLDSKYAGTHAFIEDNQAVLQDIVSWKGENGESLATFATNAGDNFASASQVSKIVDKDGNVIESSIVTAVNNNASSISLSADNIVFTGQKLDIKVDATNIEGSLRADQIEVTDLSAFNANIGGWTIESDRIYQGSTHMISSDNVTDESLVTEGAASPIRLAIGALKYDTVVLNVYADAGWIHYQKMLDKDIVSAEIVSYKNQNNSTSDYSLSVYVISGGFVVTGNHKYESIDDVLEVTVKYAYRLIEDSNLKVLDDGSLYASAAKITGDITATSGSFTGQIYAQAGGNIGGWQIDSNGIHKGDTRLFSSDNIVCGSLVDTTDISPIRLAIGRAATSKTITIRAQSVNGNINHTEFFPEELISVTVISSTDPNGYEDEYELHTNIVSNGFVVYGEHYGGPATGDATIVVECVYYDYMVKALDDGSLYASAAQITGNIIATGGEIGGFVIEDAGLHKGSTWLHTDDSVVSRSILTPNTPSPIRLAIGNYGQSATKKVIFDDVPCEVGVVDYTTSFDRELVEVKIIDYWSSEERDVYNLSARITNGGYGIQITGYHTSSDPTVAIQVTVECTYKMPANFEVLDDGSLYATAVQIDGEGQNNHISMSHNSSNGVYNYETILRSDKVLTTCMDNYTNNFIRTALDYERLDFYDRTTPAGYSSIVHGGKNKLTIQTSGQLHLSTLDTGYIHGKWNLNNVSSLIIDNKTAPTGWIKVGESCYLSFVNGILTKWSTSQPSGSAIASS